jgi:ribosomal-protein-alanine N-acetyltransferase
MRLRAGTLDDAPAMSRVHALSFDSCWSAPDIVDLARMPGAFSLAVESEEAIDAFILVRAMAGEAEVLTLAVAPALRRRGVGRDLVEAAALLAAEKGAARLFLEVDTHNEAAVALYRSLGFDQIGVRRDYYAHADGSRADALVFSRRLNSGPG